MTEGVRKYDINDGIIYIAACCLGITGYNKGKTKCAHASTKFKTKDMRNGWGVTEIRFFTF